MPVTYAYPRPSVTCDVVLFAPRADDLAVLLIERKHDPFKGAWALPGGFVDEGESLERAAARELREETGVGNVRLVQVGAFGDPGRDPRGHTITIAFAGFRTTEPKVAAGDDAAAVAWHPLRSLDLGAWTARRAVAPLAVTKGAEPSRARPAKRSERVKLAFDHARIVTRAYRRLCRYLDDPVRDGAFDVVPPRFTLAELKRTYELILGRTLTPAMMKRFVVDRELVVRASKTPTAKAAEQLYRWSAR